MKVNLDCYPCFITQALRAARMITDQEEEIRSILADICRYLAQAPSGASPPEIGRDVYRIIAEKTRVEDPFQAVKSQCTRLAMAAYPEFKRYVHGASDSILAAARLAIAGNIIDFGTAAGFDLEKDVRKVLTQEFAVDDYADFRRALEKAGSILYLGDNAGETVFDRIFIEELGKPVVFVVRESPIINDAVWEDAEAAGMHRVAEIVSSGCSAPGTIPDMCSARFLRRMRSADLIISKGQGNYEGLSGSNLPIFFLLKAKCRVVAADIGVEKGQIVFMAQKSGRRPVRLRRRSSPTKLKLVVR